MSLFSFGKKVKLYAPVDGTLVDLSTVAADETGFAVTPDRHHIFSPITGTVSALIPEQRAIKLSTGKLDVLLKMGTNMSETPATYVHEGDQVTPETPLAFVDQEQANENNEDTTVMVIVENAAEHAKGLKLSTSGQVSHDQEVATVVAK
ncbi:PTS glucose transporter subunit IIA [Lactiplantibacillus pentosus]|uniref:PTS glucose transporter subunit IIA n=1 Tax=Lactiplantibacillus pentosus TaxID=1589 RepID=UPI003C145722